MSDETDEETTAADALDGASGEVPRPSSGPDSDSGSGGRVGRGAGRRSRLDLAVEEMAEQRRTAQRLEGLLTDHADALSQAVPRIAKVEQRIGLLAGKLAELAGASTDDDEPDTGPYDDAALRAHGLLPDPGHQVDWHLMSAEQAHPAWEALAAWVATVVCGRLGFTRAQLPDCWALHPDVVAELSWAHQLHRLYAGAKIGPPHLAEWHTRWLPHLRARLETLLSVDVLDPRHTYKSHRDNRDDLEQREELRPRCRPGHYHHLSLLDRDRVEEQFVPRGPRPADPAQSPVPAGMDEFSRVWITGLLSGKKVETVSERDCRARDQRRAQAQLALNHAGGYDPRAGRPGPPERPRYLAAHPGDDHSGPGSPAIGRAFPQHWLALYLEAAHTDLARRRHRDQHGHQPHVDVTLGHLHPVPDGGEGSA